MPARRIIPAWIVLAALAACQAQAPESADAAAATEDAGQSPASTPPVSSAAQAATDEPAQDDGELDPSIAAMVQLAASMTAATAACDLAAPGEVEAARNGSREAMVARGGSAAAHDRVYDAAFDKATEQYASAPAAERAKGCEELKTFGEQMQQAAAQMAPAQPPSD